MQRREDNVAARLNGNALQPLADVQVTVTDDKTGLPASLYSDNGVTPLAQPIVTDNNGYYGYYAANGEYTETFTSPRIETQVRKVVLQDPDDNPHATKAELAAGSGSSLVTFTQAASGAVSAPVADVLGVTVSVFRFMTKAQIADAKSGNPVLDHTAAVQAALDSLPRVLDFNGEATFRVGVLQIKGKCELRGNGCGLLGTDLGIFHAVTAMPYLSIHGFKKVAWLAGDNVGLTGRHFFWNGNNAAGSTAYGAALAYDIADLRIYDNAPGASKIECFGLGTLARIYDNNWKHAAGVSVAPAYLYAERGTTDDNAGPVYIEGNHFDVYPPDGLGKSIVKVSGGVTDGQIHRNFLRNNNPNCLAHLDVFTGGHKMRCTENTLVDVQLHRKQAKGSLPAAPTLYQLDYIAGNSIECRLGSINSTCMYFIGALGTIVGNQIKARNASVIGYGIQFDPSDVDIGMDTTGAVANIISSNIFDLRGMPAGSASIKIPTGSASGTRLLVVSGNIALGGSYFMQGGGQSYTATIGNVWGYSTSSIGTSFNGGSPNNLMMGNVADSTVPVLTGSTAGNLVTLGIPTLDAVATPDVSAADIFFISSGTPVTGFTGGYIGKRITILTGTGGTVNHTSNIQLKAGAAYVLDTYNDSLELMQVTSTQWREV